jgi:hypothetical protein
VPAHVRGCSLLAPLPAAQVRALHAQGVELPLPPPPASFLSAQADAATAAAAAASTKLNSASERTTTALAVAAPACSGSLRWRTLKRDSWRAARSATQSVAFAPRHGKICSEQKETCHKRASTRKKRLGHNLKRGMRCAGCARKSELSAKDCIPAASTLI